MSGFTDAAGRKWELRLDAPLIKRIKSLCGITLTDLKADPFLELAVDPVKLVDVIWLCVEKQAHDAGVTDTNFGENLGITIRDATAALEDAVIDFFPPTMQSSLRSLLSKNRRIQTQTMQQTIDQLDEREVTDLISATAREQMLTSLGRTNSE
jgi:hypothetical protein